MKGKFKSKPYYYKVYGEKALFTSPSSRGSGDKFSYMVPTNQALIGITDSIYRKPTFNNIVDEVKIINEVTTETMGVRTLVKNGTAADLNYYTYLTDVCYYVKFHYEWNNNREDLIEDRNEGKHHAIMMRSLEKGGRFDIFLGTSECMGYVERVSEVEYENVNTFYDDTFIDLGIMFHSFIYPSITNNNKELISCFAPTLMENGTIKFISQNECKIRNVLSDYDYKSYKDSRVKPVDDEIKEMKIEED